MMDAGVDSTGTTPFDEPYFNIAARNSSVLVVQKMIDAGASISALGSNDATALHYAATGGDVAIAKLLIQAGGDIHATDKDEETVLHYAAAGGHIEMAKLLIEAGIDINVTNEDGETPLHKSVGHITPNAAETMIWLIEQGADVNAQESRFSKTPIMNFLFWSPDNRVVDAPAVLQAAVVSGYDISLGDHIGQNILHYASWVSRDPKLVQYLVDQGADIAVINDEGETAYDLASKNIYLVDTDAMNILTP
jgi:ankyrin repeat protein